MRDPNTALPPLPPAADGQPAAARPEDAARLQLLIGQVPAILWTTDTMLRLTSTQGAVTATVGYAGERVIGMTLHDFYQTEDDAFPPIAAHQRALRGESAAYEVSLWGRWWDCHVEPLRDVAGQVVGAVGLALDVTERRQAEEALREQEAQYRGIFEATTDGLVIRSLDGLIVEVNPAYCQMHGYAREEMIGRHLTAFIHRDYHHVLAADLATVTAGRTFEAQSVNVRKDGTPFHVEVRGSTFMYRGRPHALAVVRDIGERVQAYQVLEQRVAERTRELSTLLDVSRTIASTLELKPLLGLILDQLKVVVEYTGANIATVDGDDIVMLEYRGPAGPGGAAAASDLPPLRLPLARWGTLFELTNTDDPVIIGDVRGDEPLAHAFQAALDEHTAQAFSYVRSLLSVPLMVQERVAGKLNLAFSEPNYYTPRHAELARAIASQAAIAIENARLYERAQEEARKTAALARIASQVALGGLLETALNEIARHVVEASGLVACSLMIAAGDPARTVILGAHGLPEGYSAALEVVLRSDEAILNATRYHDPNPIVVHNMRQLVLSQPAYAPLQPFMPVVTWETMVSLPCIYQGRHVARLNLYYPAGQEPSDADMAFLTAIADQAAIATENARLYQQAQEEARKTAALAKIASSVALGGPLEAAIGELARNVVEASGAVACTVALGEGDPPRSRLVGSYGMPDGYAAALEAVMRSGVQTMSSTHFYDPQPVVGRHLPTFLLSRPEYAPLHPFMREATWDTTVSLPLAHRGRHLGRLNLYYAEGQEPGEAEMTFLTAMTNQAALAVENARLFAEAQGKAALEERQRLARELHDSVSQALYGIVLGTETARQLLERDPRQLAGPLEYVHSLAEAGLTEMRALIFELRPESLATEGLVAALTKHAAAMRARYQIEVTTTLCDEPEIPLEVKEPLYRIAQEALHNVVKHAEASHVDVRLACEAEWVVLEVRDNGVGFDTGGEFPGHLGLRSMRERAVRAGGSLAVESAPGQGTTIRARVPASAG